MKFVSTRGSSPTVSMSEAIEQGLAPDGGLYMPETLPSYSLSQFVTAGSLAATAELLLAPFFKGDPLQNHLHQICTQAFNFPVPLKLLSMDTAVLELFHGPTAAFKDIGARFLAECFAKIPTSKGASRRTIFVATSGDTGGAVASAFFNKPGVEIVILFPKDGVSPLQEKQLTCWGGNIRSFAVRGNFDDCQRLVKAAFAELPHLTSANSINIGRILPQMVYYAFASLRYLHDQGEAPGFAIPTGNAGNAMAALWVKKMGFPIREILMTTNANRVIADYFEKGALTSAPSVKTLANAMDVGTPSNFERIIHMIPKFQDLKQSIQALSVSDEKISQTIRDGETRYHEIWCPHTATAVYGREQKSTRHWIIVATAHPAKFRDIVEPLTKKTILLPRALAELMNRPQHVTVIEADLEALRHALR